MKTIILLALVAVAAASPFQRTYPKVFPDRIVGGSEATRGQFPSIVQIRRGTSHYCGGTLLNANVVLTAAHCATLAASQYTLVAGEHNLNSNEGSEQSRAVSSITRHASYNSNTLANDIAVMRVTQAFTTSQYVQFVSRATAVPAGGVSVRVAGWGTTSSGGSLPTSLRYVDVPMVATTTCNSNYSGQILAGMICAGETGKDSCQGDSGGPLYNSAGQQIGIVSWGYGCAAQGYPGVYTSVPYFASWITSNS